MNLTIVYLWLAVRLFTLCRYNVTMKLVVNKRAVHDYTIEQQLVAGILLSGPEVKSLRLHHGSLQGSYVKIVGGEVFLLNAMINPYVYARQENYDPKQTRKLLLSRHEIDRLMGVVGQNGRTLVPLAIETEHRRLKLVIGVGKGKKQHEKRDLLKRRDEKRRVDASFKTKLKGF